MTTTAVRKLRPPVKWPGGKHYMASKIIPCFPEHRVYLEPFGGGASVLLNKLPAEVETYNDLDRRLSNFFSVLQSDGEEFIEILELTPYSQIEFAAAAQYPEDASDIQKAVCDFVRWRQSFGGQGKSWSFTTGRARGGMAGDVNAWWSSIRMLPEIVRRLRCVQICGESAFDVIPRFDHPHGLIYCDPPYLHSTRSSPDIYNLEMSDSDHEDLAKLLHRCKAKVVLSGYPSEMYRTLYGDWRTVDFDIANHAAGGKSKARMTERLWLNF